MILLTLTDGHGGSHIIYNTVQKHTLYHINTIIIPKGVPASLSGHYMDQNVLR